MNERIRELRKMLGISQSEFADTLNLKQNSISLIEVGKRNPSDRTISDICQKFNVSEEWIRNGTGDVFLKTPSSTMEKLKSEFHLDEFAYSFVYEYLKLDNEKRNAVQEFFYNVLNGMDSAEHTEIETMAPKMEKSAVEEAEAEYIKKISISAGNTESTALNTIDDIEKGIRNVRH